MKAEDYPLSVLEQLKIMLRVGKLLATVRYKHKNSPYKAEDMNMEQLDFEARLKRASECLDILEDSIVHFMPNQSTYVDGCNEWVRLTCILAELGESLLDGSDELMQIVYEIELAHDFNPPKPMTRSNVLEASN